MAIIKDEVLEIKEKYGDERNTDIVVDARDLEDEDLIPNEDMVVTITQDGYIKRVPLDTYKQQRRGGVGLIGHGDQGGGLRHRHVRHPDAQLSDVLHQPRPGLRPEGVQAAGRLPSVQGQSDRQPPAEAGGGREDHEDHPGGGHRPRTFLVFATKKGIIKKTVLEAYANIRSCGIIAVGLKEEDELVDVKITDGKKEIILATRDGQAVRFERNRSGRWAARRTASSASAWTRATRWSPWPSSLTSRSC